MNGSQVIYECYPHLNAEGGTWIRGTIETVEGVVGIRTHPDDMKGESLQGMSDFIPLENVPHWEASQDEYERMVKNCPCHRCHPNDTEVLNAEHDYCYQIAYEIDENGNYRDDEGNHRNGQTHDIINTCEGCGEELPWSAEEFSSWCSSTCAEVAQ